MSIIFAPYVRRRGTGELPIDSTAGVPAGNPNMGAWALRGKVSGVNSAGTADHHNHGLPFNAQGRVMYELDGTIAYYDQGLPFNAGGLMCVDAGPISYYNQGVAFSASGRVVVEEIIPYEEFYYQFEDESKVRVEFNLESEGMTLHPDDEWSIQYTMIVIQAWSGFTGGAPWFRASSNVACTLRHQTLGVGAIDINSFNPSGVSLFSHNFLTAYEVGDIIEMRIRQRIEGITAWVLGDDGEVRFKEDFPEGISFPATPKNNVRMENTTLFYDYQAFRYVNAALSEAEILAWPIWVRPDGPVWATIPDKWDYVEELGAPADYDVSGYVDDVGAAVTLYEINPPVEGFSISAAGVISVADVARAPETIPVIVEATNSFGTNASAPFDWQIRIYPSNIPIESLPDWYFQHTTAEPPSGFPDPTRSWLYYTPQTNSVGFDDRAANPAADAARRGVLYTLQEYSDVELSCILDYAGTLGLTSHALVARYVDSDNYMSVRVRSSVVQFHERIAGVATNVNIAQIGEVGDEVKLRVVGTTATLLVNDLVLYTDTVLSTQPQGRVGMLNVTQGDPLFGRFITDWAMQEI